MILSTKLYFKSANDLVGLKCAHCSATPVFIDAAARRGPPLCAAHMQLEDLDPDTPLNQGILQGVPVSRKTAFPECMDLSDLVSDPVHDVLTPRRGREIWMDVRIAGTGDRTVKATDLLADWVDKNCIYGASELDKQYYLQVLRRETAGQDVVLVVLKHQKIIGQKFLAIIPYSAFQQFVGEQA